MSEKEMINNLIDKFTDLQRIKNDPNELEYQLKVIRAKLESFGIITTDLEK